MNIGELFVNLGIKGNEKTIGAITSTRKGMGELASTSLEAKAAIVGAVYALERLMSGSAQAGTNLSNFNALTGLSAKELQQWQYAARQAGVSGDELTGSVKAVQQSMTNMLLGKGAPEGMGMLAKTVGFDEKRARDTFYVMQKLQEFSKKVGPDMANSVMKSFGLNEGVIAAMRKGVFNEKNFAKAPIYSGNQVEQLNKVDVAWKNLGAKIEMAFGKFTAKHGMQIVSDLSKMTDQVFRLIDAFTRLAEKLKVFEVIGTAVDGLAKIMQLMNGDSMEQVNKGDDLKKHHFGDNTWWMNGINKMEEKFLDFKSGTTTPGAPTNAPAPSKQQNININQNLHFQHDGKDAKKTGDSVHKAVRDSYRQMSSQGQST